jgi:uncharacterized protein involved in exopolysaccharide biosynthesis
MQHGNWDPYLRAVLEARRREAAEADAAARQAELALTRRLMPGASHQDLRAQHLRADRGLRHAREDFRERHRRLVTLRDECAGIEADLEMLGA